jgi:hypothetical protein
MEMDTLSDIVAASVEDAGISELMPLRLTRFASRPLSSAVNQHRIDGAFKDVVFLSSVLCHHLFFHIWHRSN